MMVIIQQKITNNIGLCTAVRNSVIVIPGTIGWFTSTRTRINKLHKFPGMST